MAYDEVLGERIRDILAAEPDVTERRMFGGLAFLVRGNMAVAASREGGLLVRIDVADADELLAAPGVSPMEMRGRGMRGWLRVEPSGVRTQRQLARWVSRGAARARSLPPR